MTSKNIFINYVLYIFRIFKHYERKMIIINSKVTATNESKIRIFGIQEKRPYNIKNKSGQLKYKTKPFPFLFVFNFQLTIFEHISYLPLGLYLYCETRILWRRIFRGTHLILSINLLIRKTVKHTLR